MAQPKLTPSHPDAVFGPDTSTGNDLLVQLVERLQSADVSALQPPAQSRVAAAIAVAAQRLVADYARLTLLRRDVEKANVDLDIKTEELNAREQLITAREALIRIHSVPEDLPNAAPKRWWWK